MLLTAERDNSPAVINLSCSFAYKHSTAVTHLTLASVGSMIKKHIVMSNITLPFALEAAFSKRT